MFSERPAREVLASAAVSTEQTVTADQISSTQSTMKLPLPSHHGLMVGDRKIVIEKAYKVGIILRELLSLIMYLLRKELYSMCTNLGLSQHVVLVYLIWKKLIAMGASLILPWL
jgi:hypothetical protein